MTERNIQLLFSAIQLAQVTRYLKDRQWAIKELGNRIQFERIDPATNEMRFLALPSEQTHPRFRSMVPNVVFSLAVLENREAIDIAEEIVKVPLVSVDAASKTTCAESGSIPISGSEKPLPDPIHLEFRNNAAQDVRIHVDGWSRVLDLEPSDSLIIRLLPSVNKGASENKWTLDLESDVKISGVQGGIAGVFMGISGSDSFSGTSEELAEKILQALSPFRSGAIDNDNLKEGILSAVRRFQFATESAEGQEVESSTLIRAAATLIVDLAKRLRPSQDTSRELFRWCRCILKQGNRTFIVDPTTADQLWLVAREDDVDAPRGTTRLLRELSISL